MSEGLQAAVGEARQFTVEHGEKLRQDLSEELVEVRQQCEGRTEVVESKVEEVREEVTRLRRSLEEQSLGAWGRPECPESVGQGHPYAFSEPGDVNRGVSKTQSMYMWSAPAPEDGAFTPPPSPPLAPPSQLSAAVSSRHAGVASVPRKPAEFGGQVAWEAYHAQFELLAQGQGWSAQEKALQLVASLRGPALEILAHMTVSQRSSYIAVVEVLRRRFGSVFQAEVYREQLKGRTRRPGESLPQLAQAVESLVRHAYPVAAEEMVTVLSRDAFIDALEEQQVQIYMK